MYTPFATMTKVSGTTAYDANDLIANSATAGSVTPLSWATNGVGTAGHISRVRVAKSSNVATQASFRIHLFSASPVVNNGDNGAFSITTAQYYIASVAADMTTGGFAGTAYLWKSFEITNGAVFKLPALNSRIYGLIQAIGTYTPTSSEVFEITLEIL